LVENRKHYKTKRNMEHFHKHSDLLDNIKGRVKDGEYKMLMESLAAIKDIKKEVYVKVIRITCETTIYTETIKNDDDEYETHLRTDMNEFRYEVCNGDCQCGECNREPLKTVEVKTGMKQETIWMKVVEDREHFSSGDCIGRFIFDMLKRTKTMRQGNGDILVYLEDNE